MSRIISVGGSIATGSSPWIDILSSCPGFRSVKGELRIGDSGLYTLLSRIYTNETPSLEEFGKVRASLVEYGKKRSLAVRLAVAMLSRSPGLPKGVEKKIREYRAGDAGKRGYNQIITEFSAHSSRMVDELMDLVERADSLDEAETQDQLKYLMSEYVSLLFSDPHAEGGAERKVVIDQLFAPKFIFDKRYGMVLPKIFDDVKFVVVRRDPRDQFIDLLAKKRNGYNRMSPDSAVSTFLESYLPRYDRMKRLLKTCDTGRVHAVWFEDIVYDLDAALFRLEKFIGLRKNSLVFGGLDQNAVAKKMKMYESGTYGKEISLIESKMEQHLYPGY